jgi:hypothetical protein
MLEPVGHATDNNKEAYSKSPLIDAIKHHARCRLYAPLAETLIAETLF